MENKIVYPSERVTLMSCQDFLLNPELLGGDSRKYWLYDAGTKGVGFVALSNGCTMGTYVNYRNYVKPVLVLLNSASATGDTITYKYKEWLKYKEEKLDKKNRYSYFICKESIGWEKFDDNSNEFKGSHIEEFIQNELKIINTEIYNPKLEQKKLKKAKAEEVKAEKQQARLDKLAKKRMEKSEKIKEKQRKNEEKKDE